MENGVFSILGWWWAGNDLCHGGTEEGGGGVAGDVLGEEGNGGFEYGEAFLGVGACHDGLGKRKEERKV